jgi:hypothetical protein
MEWGLCSRPVPWSPLSPALSPESGERGSSSPRLLALTLLAFVAACAPTRFDVKSVPVEPFDAVIVPGCPSEEDGSPSRCQLGRAGQAAILWREGWTRNFIVSGSDVHTPYVEAEAIAQAMTLLGVPAQRILLERDALHTDENVYYSLHVAEAAGFRRLAVASYAPAAAWMCVLMERWGHKCSAIPMDEAALEKFLPPYDSALKELRAEKVPVWEPLDQREARIAKVNGYSRPPSWFFYPFYRFLGRSHRPIAPEHQVPITWEERLESSGRTPQATPPSLAAPPARAP